MLPFLHPKKVAGLVISKRAGVDTEVANEVDASQPRMDEGLKAAAEDLLRAIEQKSVIGICSALQAAYECCEAAPEGDEAA